MAEAVCPNIVIKVVLGHGQIGAATLVTDAVGTNAPDVGIQIYPMTAFRLPLVTEFIGAAADIRIQPLDGSDQILLSRLHIVFVSITHQDGSKKRIHLAEADLGIHVVQVDLLLVRQIPVVFQQQGSTGYITVGYFFFWTVKPCHVGI